MAAMFGPETALQIVALIKCLFILVRIELS